MTKQEKNLRNRIKRGKDPAYSFETLNRPKVIYFDRMSENGKETVKQLQRLSYPLKMTSNSFTMKQLEEKS